MTPLRRLGLPLGLVLGVVGLAVVVAFGVLLPEASGSDSDAVDLPDTLPGGWTAVDRPTGLDGDDADRQADRERAVRYVEDVYAEVYDAPVAFRAYADQDLQDFLVVTVFTGEGGAFGPPSGLADPDAQGLERATTELVREDDTVCIVNQQAVPQGQDASGPPLAVTCQLAADGHTVQLTSNGHSVDDTVALTHDVAEKI
ncbi:hypothetical protein G5V58_25295 [Nocardioides anomalus]|uniref:Uncharacterized protein n=1 Tax=Nocardioides anomalus TaxID=2712223 RepID=A0A6G6WKE9_9ACTN|nr:hypothetical protein [Nocardioides anomalus]QIG45613.1 hypothetical protein G5V58_25295 [Nocardioides anomalus]